MELGQENKEWFSLAGFWSWVAWRSAYLTRLGAHPITFLHSLIRRLAAQMTSRFRFSNEHGDALHHKKNVHNAGLLVFQFNFYGTLTAEERKCAGTFQNRLYVMINWTTSLLFGRDVSRW